MYVLDGSWSLWAIDCCSDLVHLQHRPASAIFAYKYTKNARQYPSIRAPEAEPTAMPMLPPVFSVGEAEPDVWPFTKPVHMKTAATMRRGEKMSCKKKKRSDFSLKINALKYGSI